MEQIVQAGLSAPSGRSIRPVHLFVVRDLEKVHTLAACRQGASAQMLARAGAAIVVAAETDCSDTWIEDCSLAMGYMHLMASSLGLGSCWVQGRGREAADGRPTQDFVFDLLGIDENLTLEAVLAIGVPEEPVHARTAVDLDASKVCWM
ncbi:MAG: nitroreductase family protein [Eggerthellaceae bacterium]